MGSGTFRFRRTVAIVGGLVLVAEGVAGVVDQANPCGLAAGLGLSNAGLGPAYILVAGGFRLVCGRLVCAGRVQGMGMGMGVVAFAGHGGFCRAWWLLGRAWWLLGRAVVAVVAIEQQMPDSAAWRVPMRLWGRPPPRQAPTAGRVPFVF